MKIPNYLLCAFTVISCTTSVQKEQTYEKIHYSQKIELSRDLLRPGMFCVVDTVVMIYDNNRKGDNLFYAFNIITGNSYCEFGSTGSGPGDFIFPVQMEFDETTDEIRIFDQSYSKLYCYRLSDIIGSKASCAYQIKIPSEASRVALQNDSSGYCLGAFSAGMIGKIKNGAIIRHYLDFPDIKGDILNPIQKFGLYQGNITMNRNKTKLVYFSARCDLIKIISVENDTVTEIMTQHTYTPKYRKGNDDFLAVLPENPNGYISVSVSDDYIFALFSGRNEKEYGDSHYFGDILHIFDWNGKLIKKITLDKDAWQISVDSTSDKLYTIHFATNEPDDFQVQYYVYNIII